MKATYWQKTENSPSLDSNYEMEMKTKQNKKTPHTGDLSIKKRKMKEFLSGQEHKTLPSKSIS